MLSRVRLTPVVVAHGETARALSHIYAVGFRTGGENDVDNDDDEA